MSSKKKKKYVEPPPETKDDHQANYDKIFWYAPHTQKTQPETVVLSEEIEFRRTHFPSYHEKVKVHQKYMKMKLKNERMVEMLQAAKVKFDEDAKKAVSGRKEDVAGLTEAVVEMSKARTAAQEEAGLDDAEMEDFDDEAFKM